MMDTGIFEAEPGEERKPMDALPENTPAAPPAAALLPDRIAPPVHARGLALAILAGLAFVFALQWAQRFFVPLLFGIIIAYTLNPLVAWLERLKIPRLVGTCLVMAIILGGIVAGAEPLLDQTQSIMERLPDSARKISHALNKWQDGQPSTIQRMQSAATEIENAAGRTPLLPASAKKSASPEPSQMKVSDWVVTGSMNAVMFVGQVAIVVFLVFFLLLSGDTFKRKLVKLTGPSISKKKITVHILDEINVSIQNYMFMLLMMNVLLALVSWIAYRWIGLENAGAWAVAAGFFHIIPYLGPMIMIAATGLASFMQFESFSMLMLVSGISLAIAILVGTVITTWMTGRVAKMNTAAVFISLLFWGWLWGICGMLLGIPIIVIVKVIAEHIEGLQPIAELLGE
jgi:predicted PurR-regulated permease PerM